MVRIIISTRGGTRNPTLVSALRKLTQKSVADIAEALADGGVLFEGELFARPRAEQIEKVRGIFAALKEANIEPEVVEGERRIPAAVVLYMIKSSEESIAEFSRLDELGHEA